MLRRTFAKLALAAALSLALVLPVAASLQFDSTTRDNFNTQIINAVGTSGTLNIYSGTPPANVAASLSGNTLLVSLPCSATFGTTSGGVLTVNAITTTNGAATGTASFFRFATSGGTAKVQGTVGTSGSDLNLVTTSITSGQPVQVTSWTITAPGQ